MRQLLFLALLFFTFQLQSQTYSRVKILLDEKHQMQDLAGMGLDVDHGLHKPYRYYIGELADHQIDLIRSAGFTTEILVEDLQIELLEKNAHFHEHGHAGANVNQRNGLCDGVPVTEYETPENYVYGTMGGYLTLDEMYAELDKMASMYPDIFKTRTPITTDYFTHENRPVFWVKISDDPEVDDPNESEVLYTALHHAREPNSMAQLIFYMWYLLENYETDEEVKYLVDNVEMYFVPCLNPDGYVYNQATNPDGGGLWRKNRRDNGDGTFGVDLNRNYPYEWGIDDQGSSPLTNGQTYRGPSPGSEPETQMIMQFCEAHEFQITLNYHTFGNLLIYPWGYTDGASPDHWTFTELAGFMIEDNDYLAGFGSQTVGYTVNGVSDDWMYGEQSTKGKIYSMTPEVGPTFWPSQAEIDELNKSCMKMNLNTAHLVLNFANLRPAVQNFISELSGSVDYSIRKIGLASGVLEVYLEAVSDNIATTGGTDTYGLFHLEEAGGNISFNLDPTIEEGELVQFNLVLDNGLYQWREPVEMIYSTNVGVTLAEPGDDLGQWTGSTDWTTTAESFYSAPSSVTDSEGGNYLPSQINDIELDEPISIENAIDVRLTFWAKWNIEEDEDYAQIRASENGNVYSPLCGLYSEVGTDEQAFDEPVYDGLQNNWVREEIDLTEFLDSNGDLELWLNFRMFSDEMVELDGFYFDDLQVSVVYEEEVSSTINLDKDQFSIIARPNPATDYVLLDIESEEEFVEGLNLHIFNALGQNVSTKKVQGKVVKMNTSDWESGLYFYHVSDGERSVPAGRFIVKN